MTGFDRDLIGEGFDRGDSGVTKFREERTPLWEFILYYRRRPSPQESSHVRTRPIMRVT